MEQNNTQLNGAVKTDETMPPGDRRSRVKRLINSKKGRIIMASSAIVLVTGGVLSWALLSGKDVALPSNVTNDVPMLGGAVTLIDGTAQISSDGETWQPLTTATAIKQGDTITTDPASRVILTFDNGSAVRLDESTAISIDSLNVEDVRISNRSGNVYNRVVASERSFTVSVEGTDYTALGTAFHVINKPTDKGVQVLESAVAVSGQDAKVDEGKQYYSDNSNQELEQKITDISLDELRSNGFIIWNFEQDENSDLFKDKLGVLKRLKEQKEAEPAPETSGDQIKLSATVSDKGVVLSWTVSGVQAPDGFKIVRSKKNALPTFGKDESQYAASPDARSYIWKSGDGGAYTYRVCIYKPGTDVGCSPYSNTVTIESPEILPEAPVQGTVHLTVNGVVASWTDTGTAPHGWKLLVSKNPNPVYGGKDIMTYYTGSPHALDDLAPGSYYIRVCKYTATNKIDNGCTNYSNEVSLIVPGEE